jgi:hypothetical protein
MSGLTSNLAASNIAGGDPIKQLEDMKMEAS